MKIKNLSKMPKRKVTIDEVLSLDNIGGLLDDVYGAREDVSELFVIWTGREDSTINWCTNGMQTSRKIYLLEHIKYYLFNKLDEE